MQVLAANIFEELAVWLIVTVLVAFGFRYFKKFMAFVLDELYQIFIQNNPDSV